MCVQIKNKVHHVNQLIEPDLMYTHMTFSKKNHCTPLHLPIQNILLAVDPFHCFLQKASGPGKNTVASTIVMQKRVKKFNSLGTVTVSTPFPAHWNFRLNYY